MRIDGCVALVSGGSSGLGAAVVHALLARGARVASLDRKPSDDATLSVIADVTDETRVADAVRTTVKTLGAIACVINCAGIGVFAPILVDGEAGPLAPLGTALDVNLVGTYNVVRFAVAAMQHNVPDTGGERGVIVNTASISALDGPAGFAAYSASKAGVIAMTDPLARELAPLGIRVCAIAPGMFETPMLRDLPPDLRRDMIDQMMFPRRPGAPASFAALALHIVENDYLNATTIRIDAGARAPTAS